MDGRSVMTDLQDKINKLPKKLADELVDFINHPSNKQLFRNADIQDELIDSWMYLKKSDLEIPNCK